MENLNLNPVKGILSKCLKSFCLVVAVVVGVCGDVWGEDLNVGNNANEIISSNRIVDNATISGGNSNSSIIIRNGATLTVNGNLTINAPTTYNNLNKYIDVQSGGTLIVKGDVTMATTGGNSRDCFIKINDNSTVTIEGNITMGSTNTRRNYIWFAGDGTINIGGSFTGGFVTREGGGGTATTNFGTGTIGYINTKTPGTPQTIIAYTYNNLVLGEGDYIAGGDITVTKNFKTDGIFDTNQKTIRFNGTTECGNGSIEANYENINTYYAPTAQYIIKGNYRGLIFNNGTRGTHYTCGDITILDRTQFNNASGTEIHANYDIEFNRISARTDAFIYASSNTTITYGNNQKILGGEYYNLSFADGKGNKTPYGDILINGTMTWNDGRFLLYNDGSTYNFTLGPTATISSTGAYASGHCFVFENGATEGFLTVKGDVSRLNNGTIPVGNTNKDNYQIGRAHV